MVRMFHTTATTALLLFSWLTNVSHSDSTDDSEYFCWPANERTNLSFVNNPSKVMTHLPVVRLIQGYYPSQFAMQYAAFVYLREMMGITVSFYPSNDPNALFERYTGYLSSNWCNVSNASTCSPYAPYPQFYFEHIKQDEYDLLFEIWDVMVYNGKGFEYQRKEEVIMGGMSGVYSEGGWFVPSYLYDDHPEWILPSTLKNDAAVRQIFMDAYTNQSDVDYVARWWEIWGDKLPEYEQHGYGLPNYSTPIVFGSYEEYGVSLHSQGLVQNLLDSGIDWTFAALGSEPELSAFVADLYSKRLPFIANIYSPHLDFATLLPGQSEYMQFERIALPRNPNNDVQDVCYAAGECTFPISPLLKLANPRLSSAFPEILDFMTAYRMSTNDVNEIVAYYHETATYESTLSEHQRWINATCKWLKQSNATTQEWKQTVDRFDCIFEQGAEEQCGFNYFYHTVQDAQRDENRVSVPWYSSVGARCLNSSLTPMCECSSPYFVGASCRDSCPGLIGPILHYNAVSDEENSTAGNSTSSSVSSLIRMDADFTIFVCSGHGECDIDHKRCQCELGFGGVDCDIQFAVFSYDTILIAFWFVLFAMCVVVLVLSIVWVQVNKHYKTIRALSPNMTTLFTIGLILLCIGTIFYLFHPLNNAVCIVRNYLYGVGAIVTIMAPLCKTYRVAIIFAQARNLKRIEIPDKQLLVYIIYATIMEAVLCSVYAVFHQLRGGVQALYLDEWNRIEYVCNQTQSVQFITYANYLYIFGLMILLCVFSFKNRATHKVFKESRCAYFGSFFCVFVFVVVVLFNVVADDIEAIITIQCGAMLVAISAVWGLFYGVRMYAFFKHPERRSEVMVTAKSKSELPQQQQKKARKGSDMPSYVHALYKERGFDSIRRGSVVPPGPPQEASDMKPSHTPEETAEMTECNSPSVFDADGARAGTVDTLQENDET